MFINVQKHQRNKRFGDFCSCWSSSNLQTAQRSQSFAPTPPTLSDLFLFFLVAAAASGGAGGGGERALYYFWDTLICGSWSSVTYRQRSLQLAGDGAEAVEHKVFTHAVDPLAARRQSAAHKVTSFPFTGAETPHDLHSGEEMWENREVDTFITVTS